MSPSENNRIGMSAAQAKRVEYAIIGFCILAVVMIFQPFSLLLFSIGCVMVVAGGLAFNLVPLCRPGVPARSLVRATVTILVILLVVVALAMAAAQLYGLYLATER